MHVAMESVASARGLMDRPSNDVMLSSLSLFDPPRMMMGVVTSPALLLIASSVADVSDDDDVFMSSNDC